MPAPQTYRIGTQLYQTSPTGGADIALTGDAMNKALASANFDLNRIQTREMFTNGASADPTGNYLNGRPLPTPSKSADGAVSSGDYTTGIDTNSAIQSAAGALTGDGSGTGGGLKILDYLNQSITSSNDSFNKLMMDIKQSVDANYDANLGAVNAQYAGLFDQLAQSHTNEVQAGAARAAALNPYSDARGASTAAGFTSALNGKYQQQYRDLTAKMQAAQAQLAAGKTDSYMKIAKEASDAQQGFQKEMRGFVQDYYQNEQEQRNADRSYGLQKAGLESQEQRAATDDFRSFLTTLSGSPELQADIATYQSTGKISAGLMPIVEKGMQAGMSPDEAISIFRYQSDSVRKQQALEDYRANQQILASERLALATERQTAGQRAIATTQMVLQAQSDMRARGIQPGTAAWANGVASATSASARGLTPTQVGKYTQMGVLANQLTSVKSSVDALNAKDPIWNTLQTYAGRDVSSMSNAQLSALNAKLTSLSGVIGKTFYGESGNLSNTDIQRVLNALPTGAGSTELRSALYKGLLSVAKDNATMTLESDAQAGYNVATYVDSINRIAEQYEAATTDSPNKFVSPSGKSYTMPSFLN